MVCLLLALLYTFTWHRRIAKQEGTSVTPLGAKLGGLLSLLLWLSVGVGGRAIGFI